MNGQMTLEGITLPRPERTADILECAAKKLLPDVLGWLRDEGKTDDVLPTLVEAMASSRSLIDGYRLARYLETHAGWDPDAILVEILDGLEGIVGDAHRAAIRDWVINNRISLRHQVGETIVAPQRLVRVHAGSDWTIASLRAEEAMYGVRHPGQRPSSEYLVNAEEIDNPPSGLHLQMIGRGLRTP